MDVTKQDWKLFQNKIASWQESYMARLNREYIEILTGKGIRRRSFGAWKNVSTQIRETGAL